MLHPTTAGTANTNWRIESRDALTGTDAWQPLRQAQGRLLRQAQGELLTNLNLGPFDGLRAGSSPTVIQQPHTSTNRFYRGAWVP